MIDTKALRKKILDLAISGKLTEQLPEDGNAEYLYAQIQEEKAKLIAEGKIKKEKSLSPISEDEIPFEIPENWKWVKFSDIVDFYLGKTPARANKHFWEEGVYPWVSISDMPDNGVIYETKEAISEKAKTECFSNSISKAGTLIMSFKLTIGKVALLGVDAYHNEAIISIFPFCDNDESIKHYLFRILPLIANNTDSHGVVMGNTLNKKSISNMLIPLPPREEQKRIVSAVEDAFAVIDRIEKAQESYYADQEVLKNKIIDAGIRGELTEQRPEDGNAEDLYTQIQEEKAKNNLCNSTYPAVSINEQPFKIPASWMWTRFGNISYIVRGGSPRPIKQYITNDPDGINWIKIGDVEKGGKYIYSTKEKIIPSGEKKSRHVFPGDFLLTNSMSFGRPYITKVEGCIHDGWLLVRNMNGFCSDYLYYLLSSEFLYKQFCQMASGATVSNLNIDKVNNSIIPLPPMDEQNRIAERIENILSKAC